ncbi:MAG TPA: aspartyl-phosphate phosphatase Spo0E family protein [Pseudoneobacillus sp.]|nr:aspartyl-phosphate phosphatase Spo0E family protein [Pseudoneobacillus sp.]
MNSKNNQTELLNQIQMLRTKMIYTGLEKGLSNIETVNISQQLDQLLLTYQLDCYKATKLNIQINSVNIKKKLCC